MLPASHGIGRQHSSYPEIQLWPKLRTAANSPQTMVTSTVALQSSFRTGVKLRAPQKKQELLSEAAAPRVKVQAPQRQRQREAPRRQRSLLAPSASLPHSAGSLSPPPSEPSSFGGLSADSAASRRQVVTCALATGMPMSTAPVETAIGRSALLLPTSLHVPSSPAFSFWGQDSVLRRAHSSSHADDVRSTIVRSAPRATAAELSTAAQMARLSSLVYYPDPRHRLEALGLELKECRQTAHTAFFVADGPSDLLSQPLEEGGRWRRRQRGGLKTRYVIARGVALDRQEVKHAELWGKLLRFFPVEFERGLTPRGADLLVHEGVKEIAEDVYQSVLPFLAIDPQKEDISAIRFGGHSLGGSLALLLLLMAHLRSPLSKGYSSDFDFTAHTFGSFPVVASLPSLHLPWDAAGDSGSPSPGHNCPLWNAFQALQNPSTLLQPQPHTVGQPASHDQTCGVLSQLGLQSGAARGFVLDSDIIPRAFLAMRHDAVRAVMNVRQKFCGVNPSRHSVNDFLFRPVGLVHLMQSQGTEVSVANLHPGLAEQALDMEFTDFIRNPSLLARSLQDHYFNHYVSRLDSALAATRAQA